MTSRMLGMAKWLVIPAVAFRLPSNSTPAFRLGFGILQYNSLKSPSLTARVLQQQHVSSSTMAASDATLRAFFQSAKFAVVGASTNTEKFGYKVFRWYAIRGLPVTPINPGAKAIEVDGKEYPTVASLSELPNPQETSVSIITPPRVTLKTLEEAKSLGIQSVFLQPGTFDDEVLKYANQNFKTVLAGNGGAGPEGWCVLVDGDRGLRSAGKL